MSLETPWPETGAAQFNPPPAEQPAAKLRYFEKRYGPTAAYIAARDAHEVTVCLNMEQNPEFKHLDLPQIYREVLKLRQSIQDNAAIDQLIENSKQ